MTRRHKRTNAESMVHAIERFERRYGKRLTEKEYIEIMEIIKHNKAEFLGDARQHGSKLYQIEWHGLIIYPVVKAKNNTILSFLRPEMAVAQVLQVMCGWKPEYFYSNGFTYDTI